MKIKIVWDLDRKDLLAIAFNKGDDKPATHDEVIAWITSLIDPALQDVRFFYELMRTEEEQWGKQR